MGIIKPITSAFAPWLLILFFLAGFFPGNLQAENSADNTPESLEKYDELDAFFTRYQPYLSNIKAYKPIYFLVGTNPEKSMFQVSLKYSFFNEKDRLAKSNPWITKIHCAYTQTSFWDLKSDSMPFDDTSYKPELFFLTSNQSRNRDRLAGLFFQAGAQHESNGQAETLSRSTNFLYFKPILIFYHAPSGYGLQVSPGVWTYWENEDETNPDLNDYRGYVDLQLKFGRADSFVMETHFWPAKKGNSVQCDITYPMNRHFKTNLNLYLHVQYANRLAESLISYKERSKALRIGFSIVR